MLPMLIQIVKRKFRLEIIVQGVDESFREYWMGRNACLVAKENNLKGSIYYRNKQTLVCKLKGTPEGLMTFINWSQKGTFNGIVKNVVINKLGFNFFSNFKKVVKRKIKAFSSSIYSQKPRVILNNFAFTNH